MTRTPMEKRPLKNVGQHIWQVVEVMEEEFGGQLTHDSGHDKRSNEKATTWILTFPRYGNAQIAVPMNQKKLSLLMRAKTVDGRSLESLVEGIAEVEKRFTNPDKGVTSAVLGPHAPFLNPSSANPLLRIKPSSGAIHVILERYLGAPRVESVSPPERLPPSPEQTGRLARTVALSEDDLRSQLERQSETGRAGEFLVVQDELERLRQCGCPDSERHVHRIAASDVGRGYDIESTWPGEERCIEVKTTTQAGSDFFITTNEREVLTALGPKAWLYRVVLKADGTGEVIARVPDPMGALPDTAFSPVVFLVDADELMRAATSITK
jgi:hypothetical protein